ncbi:TetR/AcrR family transcriptional regulator C-terminal domain-containing protein [Streptomyces sp. NPDC054841]
MSYSPQKLGFFQTYELKAPDLGFYPSHPAVAGKLRTPADQDRLVIPDLETAITQLYSLLVFPRMVFSAYSAHIDDDLTERLITSGVDMFLSHYGTHHTARTQEA